jgi:glycosyltransferase involved in cell wall biosynthesis
MESEIKHNPDRTRVSVITPVFNGSRFIREAILSVGNSSFQDYEHIVIDDGSTDNSLEVIHSTIDELDRERRDKVRVFSKSNSGEADTDNFGAAQSTGEFITVLNADDIMGSGLMSASLQLMDAHPTVIVTYPDWKKIDADGKTIEEISTLDYTIERLVGMFHCIPGPGAFVRKSALANEKLRNLDYPLMSDFECWLRLAPRGSFRRIPGFHASWRIHGSNASLTGRGIVWGSQAINLATEFVENAKKGNPGLLKLGYLGLSRAYLLAASMHFDDLRVPKWRYLFTSLRLGIRYGRPLSREDLRLFLLLVLENFTGRRTRQG